MKTQAAGELEDSVDFDADAAPAHGTGRSAEERGQAPTGGPHEARSPPSPGPGAGRGGTSGPNQGGGSDSDGDDDEPPEF